MLVDLSGRDVVVLVETDVEVSLIVSQVKIRLSTVVENVNLSVLRGGHCSGINVHVRVNLDSRDFESGGLEEKPGTRGCRLTRRRSGASQERMSIIRIRQKGPYR